MDFTLEEYFRDFRWRVLQGAELERDYKLTAFLDLAAEKLKESGFATEIEHCHYKKSRSGRVDGFYLNEQDASLDLVIADYQNRTELEPIHTEAVKSAFKKVRTFYLQCRNEALHEDMDESTPERRLAKGIHDYRDAIRRINFILISERNLSTRKLRLSRHDLNGAVARYDVWDISRFHRQDTSKTGREAVEIDLYEKFKRGIRCLRASLGPMAFQSYLCVVSGDILAKLYDEYGQQLLEQNVRCFLQARGKVNRGIRRTILKEPDMFFAYNNGITATARSVVAKGGRSGDEIVQITDFQIVNGGQTTASLFHASRQKDGPDLGQVFVQMKLTVLGDADHEIFVSNISEFANTQNKVNAADLTSNHPFQIRMEELSRGIWAPATADALRETKWFYERSRGQYLVEQTKMTDAGKRKFRAEFPRNQKFMKTDLAKFENVWDEEPRWVQLGAQKNFLQYSARIQAAWEQAREHFDESYYRRVIARAIVFKATEKLVSSQPWFEGGYRANIVAYTLSAASEISRARNLELDYMRIWREQEAGEDLLKGLAVLAKSAFNVLHDMGRPVMNPSEWAKKPEFWITLKSRLPAVEGRLSREFWENNFVQAKRAAA